MKARRNFLLGIAAVAAACVVKPAKALASTGAVFIDGIKNCAPVAHWIMRNDGGNAKLTLCAKSGGLSQLEFMNRDGQGVLFPWCGLVVEEETSGLRWLRIEAKHGIEHPELGDGICVYVGLSPGIVGHVSVGQRSRPPMGGAVFHSNGPIGMSDMNFSGTNYEWGHDRIIKLEAGELYLHGPEGVRLKRIVTEDVEA